jgi:hypothetical protein
MAQKIVDTIQKICEKDKKFNFESFIITNNKLVFSINTEYLKSGISPHFLINIELYGENYFLSMYITDKHYLLLNRVKDTLFLESQLSIYMNKIYELYVSYLVFLKNVRMCQNEVDLLTKPKYIRDLKINEILK